MKNYVLGLGLFVLVCIGNSCSTGFQPATLIEEQSLTSSGSNPQPSSGELLDEQPLIAEEPPPQSSGDDLVDPEDGLLLSPPTNPPTEDELPPPQPDPVGDNTGKIPMFVAVGRGGRTVISCDDGKTWIHDRRLSDNNEDHSPFSDKGFEYLDGVFLQLMGWGSAPRIQRSEDGIHWELLEFNDFRGSSLAISGDAFVIFNREEILRSTDGGQSWKKFVRPVEHPYQLREGGGGGTSDSESLILGGGDPDGTPTYSADGGKTWALTPQVCDGIKSFAGVGQKGGIAFGKGILIAVDRSGGYCTSKDFGKNWYGGKIASFTDGDGNQVGKPSFAKDKFWFPYGNKMHFSEDGIHWQTERMTPKNLSLQAVTAGATGTFVGFNKKDHTFYRSLDGINWTKTATLVSPVSLQRIRFGYAKPSVSCREN